MMYQEHCLRSCPVLLAGTCGRLLQVGTVVIAAVNFGSVVAGGRIGGEALFTWKAKSEDVDAIWVVNAIVFFMTVWTVFATGILLIMSLFTGKPGHAQH
jgi:hypothetical protein